MNLAGSGKILLKVTLKSTKTSPETNHTFSFQSTEDRELIKDMLARQLSEQKHGSVPSAKPSKVIVTANEIRARQAILGHDTELANLHREMVIEGVVEEEQFWETRKQLLTQQQFMQAQKKGALSASLADIKPSSVEGNDIKYTLTPDLIHSIFVHFPGGMSSVYFK